MGDDSSRTLWLGDLPFWADENYVFNLFASTGAVVSCKIIRNKVTNLSEGYGFVEFRTHEAAEQVLPLPSPSYMAPKFEGLPGSSAGVYAPVMLLAPSSCTLWPCIAASHVPHRPPLR